MSSTSQRHGVTVGLDLPQREPAEAEGATERVRLAALPRAGRAQHGHVPRRPIEQLVPPLELRDELRRGHRLQVLRRHAARGAAHGAEKLSTSSGEP